MGLRNLDWAGRWGGKGNSVGKLWMGDVTNLALCHSEFMSLLLLSKLASRRSALTASPTGYLNVWRFLKIARRFQHHRILQATFCISHSRLDIPIKSDLNPFYQQIKESPYLSYLTIRHIGTNDSLALIPARMLFSSEVDQRQGMETGPGRLTY